MPFKLIPIVVKNPVLNRRVLEQGFRQAVNETTAEGLRYIAEYPPQGASTYRRTGTLKRSWSMKPAVRRGDRIEGEVGSNSGIAPYNRKVQGDGQDPFFRGRGWRNVHDLVRLIKRQLPPRAQQAINRAAR